LCTSTNWFAQGAGKRDPNALKIWSWHQTNITLALRDWHDWIRDPEFAWVDGETRKNRAVIIGNFLQASNEYMAAVEAMAE
jgi:hypothetical protein